MNVISVIDQNKKVVTRFPATKDLTTVGRDLTNDIVLPSALVSRHHLKIYSKGDHWEVEGLGVNGTFLNNEELAPHSRHRFREGDSVEVGEFTLVIGNPREATGDELLDEERSSEDLMNVEKKIHEALLERLDLRAFSSDKVDEETVFQIENLLENLVEEHLGLIGVEGVEYIIRRALKRTLLDRILFPKKEKTGDGDGGPWSNELEQILSLIGDSCGLILDQKRVQENLDRMEKSFTQVVSRDRVVLSKGLQRFLVKKYLFRDLRDTVLGLGPLQELLNMPNINEVMVVSKDQIYVDKGHTLEKTGHRFFSDEVIYSIVERIVNPLGRRIDKSTPIVDARLADGSRVNVIIPPLALKGPCITIRKFAKIPLTVDDLIDYGSLTAKSANFLKGCVYGKKNIIISGGTGAGKTTMLNVLSSFIGARERIVTIEDSAELQLRQEHVVSLETRPPNIEGKGAYTIRDLVKNSLRMRPDRIIVGECRGAETLDMLQAMNTGHEGSMTTLHANNPADVVLRLETMVLMAADMPIPAIRQQISSAIHLIVHVHRFPEGNKKRVTHITHVIGIDDHDGRLITEDIFRFMYHVDPHTREKIGCLESTGHIPDFVEDLLREGYMNLDTFY